MEIVWPIAVIVTAVLNFALNPKGPNWRIIRFSRESVLLVFSLVAMYVLMISADPEQFFDARSGEIVYLFVGIYFGAKLGDSVAG